MKVRTISACVSTALFISFSASSVIADVSQVTDRSALIESDAIFWNSQGVMVDPLPDYYGYLVGSTSTPNVFANNGTALAVSHVIDPDFEIYVEPSSSFFRDANFADGDYLLSTFAYSDPGPGYNNQKNESTFIFSDTNAESICGFGTQIAPVEPGEFTAEIQAFDDGGAIGSPFVATGSDQDANAAFIGVSSTTAMSSVEIVVTSTGDGGGAAASWYAVNQVTLTYCSDLPVPALTLNKTSDVDTYSAIGDLINYNYLVTSSGTGPVAGPITVTDDKEAVTCPSVYTVGNNDANLDPGEALTCTASHAVVQADINAGSITNTATAAGDAGATQSAADMVTVNYEALVTALTCDGFAAPMAIHPVKAKKNRVFPLKMELFDEDGFEQTNLDIAAPVVTVMYSSSPDTIDPVLIEDEALYSGKGSDGNQFVYTDDGIWQFNLKSKNYNSSGTYYVTVDSGDESEYVIEEPSCVTSFIIK